MRKFTANYLFTADGAFLKNGIIVVNTEGLAIEFIDTRGDLREMEQLIFYSGILFPNFKFARATGNFNHPVQNTFQQFITKLVDELKLISIQDFVEFGKQLQPQFNELTIPEIFKTQSECLEKEGFSKVILPGIFRLTGTDLANLKFSPESKLKQII